MSIAIEDAFEAGQGMIFEDEEGNQAGIFSGVDLPEVTVPDAPIASIYMRSNGKVYSRSSFSSVGSPSDWQEGTGGSVVSNLRLPFCLSNLDISNIPLVSGKVPFCLSDGSPSNLEIV